MAFASVQDDGGLRMEIEFKRRKKQPLSREWDNLMQELSQNCLSFARPMAVEAHGEGMSSSSPQTTRLPVFMPSEELGAIIRKISDGDGIITHQDRRSLLKVFSKMIDGSTLGFAELSKRIEEGLKNAGVQVDSENLEVGMMILDALAMKQSLYSGLAPESAKNDSNLTYFELRELENYKMDEELDQMCDRQSHRRHIITLLQAVQIYLQTLESETGDYATRIAAIDEAERKYSEAKARLNAEKLRVERKAQNPKGSSGATSISKQPKFDHPSIVKASSSLFESGAKNFNTDTQGASSSGNQSNQQNVQQLNKVGVLTSFFGPRKEHKMATEPSKPAQEKNLFRSLGSHPVLGGSWTEEQALNFQEHLDRKKGLPPTKELWQELILSTKFRRNQQKNDDSIMVNARETAAGSDLTTQGPLGEHVDTKDPKLRVPAPRFVMIKAEDHLLNTLGYSGIFHPSAEAKPEVCAKLTKDPLYKIPGIEYDLSDSDDEAEDAESIGSKDEEDEDMSNPSIDDEEKDDFIVPDGYLSDDEMLGSNDKAERNLHLQKKPRRKKLEKLEMKVRNFIEDPASGSAYAAIAIGGTIESQPSDQNGLESQQPPFREMIFPLNCTEAATEQDELNDEVIRELLKELHCSSNKGTVITKIGEKYKYVSKAEIKLRADESCVQAIVIDPLIYKKAGLGPQKYLNDLGRMFTPDLHCTEHRLVHALDEIALNLSDARVNGHMSEKDLLSIAISMNGLPGRTVLNAQTHLTYHNQNPGIKKVSIERKLKEVGVSLFIVRRDVYETYFDAEKPKPSGDQPSQAINPELSANDLEWEILGEWFQSINKYFRSTDSHNLPNSGLQFGIHTAADTTAPVEFSQRSMAQATPADSGKTSLSSKNKQLYSQEASQGSFKNQDIRDLIKGSSGGSAFEYSNPEDSRTRQFARPKTPLEKSFANAKETQSQGATLLASSSANPAVKPAELNVSKKTTGIARSKDGPGQRVPPLALNRQEPVPEEKQEILNKKPPRPESQPVVPSSPRERRVPLNDFKIPERLLGDREQHPGTLDVENSSEEVQLQKVSFARPALSPQSLSEVEEVEIYPSRIAPDQPAAQPAALAGSPVSQAGSMTSATLAMCAGIKPSGADKSFANLIDLEDDDPDGASASGHSGIVPESTNRLPLQLGSLKTVPSPFAIQPENSRLQHTTKVDSMPAFNLDKLIEERNKKGQEEIKSRPKVQLKENRGGHTKMDIERASKRPTTMIPENQSISNSQSKVMQMFRVTPTMVDEASMGKSSNFLSVGLPVSQRDLMKATASGPVASKSDQQHKTTTSSKNDAQHVKNQGGLQAAPTQPAKQAESPARKMQLVERRSGSTSLKRSDDPPAAKPKNSVLPFVSQSKVNQEKPKPKPDILACAPQHQVAVENLKNSLNDLIRRSRTPSPEKHASPEQSQVYKKPKATKHGSKQSTSITQFIMTLPDESNSGQSGVIQVSDEGRGVQAGEVQGSPQQPGTKNKHVSKNQAATKPAESAENGAKAAVPCQKSVKIPEVPAKQSKTSSSDDEDANSSSKGPLTRSRASRGKEEPKPKDDPKKTKKTSKN